MMVECSRVRRSNIRTLPSAPQDTNMSTLPAQKRTSKTSLSCAMSCVLAVRVGMSQMVQVVSIELVMINFGLNRFQSRLVKGAVCSGVFEFESSARGWSFWGAGSLVFTLAELLILLLLVAESDGSDHSRR